MKQPQEIPNVCASSEELHLLSGKTNELAPKKGEKINNSSNIKRLIEQTDSLETQLKNSKKQLEKSNELPKIKFLQSPQHEKTSNNVVLQLQSQTIPNLKLNPLAKRDAGKLQTLKKQSMSSLNQSIKKNSLCVKNIDGSMFDQSNKLVNKQPIVNQTLRPLSEDNVNLIQSEQLLDSNIDLQTQKIQLKPKSSGQPQQQKRFQQRMRHQKIDIKQLESIQEDEKQNDEKKGYVRKFKNKINENKDMNMQKYESPALQINSVRDSTDQILNTGNKVTTQDREVMEEVLEESQLDQNLDIMKNSSINRITSMKMNSSYEQSSSNSGGKENKVNVIQNGKIIQQPEASIQQINDTTVVSVIQPDDSDPSILRSQIPQFAQETTEETKRKWKAEDEVAQTQQHKSEDRKQSYSEKQKLSAQLSEKKSTDIICGSSIRWKQGDFIGAGTFGQVFRAMNINTGEIFAVKYLKFGTYIDKEFQIQLEKEIKLMKKLSHPNIIKYLGCEEINNSNPESQCICIYLEYMDAGNVSLITQKFGKLEEDNIKIYAKQILLGLQYLHEQNVIHRDIKGANILVNNEGTVKLTDFGCAKQMEITLNSLSNKDNFNKSIRGSVPWMAPELLQQSQCNKAADIWSYGCTILEMATAKAPWSQYQFDNPIEAILKIGLNNEIPHIPESLSEELQDFLLCCLQRDPSRRKSIQELLGHRFLVTEPTHE